MSGSPKYTSVALTAARRAREAELRARRERERRERERRRREAEAAIAARRAELARRREEERVARRQARTHEYVEHSLRVAAGRVADTRRFVAELGAAAGTAVFVERASAVDEALAGIAARVAGAEPAELPGLLADAEGLRARAVEVQQEMERVAADRLAAGVQSTQMATLRRLALEAGRAAEAERRSAMADLRARFDAAEESAAGVDVPERDSAARLVREVERAARVGDGARFDVRLAEAEAALADYAAAVAEAVRSQDEAAQAERDRMAEAGARIGAFDEGVRTALADADHFGAVDMGTALRTAWEAARRAADDGPSDVATSAVEDLGRALASAEARLDELLLAAERRLDLAVALREVMADQGLACVRADDEGSGLVLAFVRPSGATYSTEIDTDGQGATRLVYTIEGEGDVSLLADEGEARCDQTESFLDAVHDALSPAGFVPGELDWDGKPPPTAARTHRSGRAARGVAGPA